MEGRLFFRLNLNDSSSEIATSKAKKRKLDNLQLIPGESSGNAPLSGYFFVPSDLSQSNFAEYLVSVPFTLLKKLCEAVVYNLKVVISKYSIAPLPTTALDCQPSAALLEVFSEGFSLLEEHPAPSMADVVLTLRELALKEMVERDGKLKSGSKEKYDIEAVVEAVSPIVAMDPTDPFALVEVHDPTLRHISCVLVMRGNHALQWHSALQPGETWQFRRLAMQSWRVPKVLMCKAVFLHLKHRIPPRVYIFSKETTLQFVKYPSGNSEPSTNSLTPSLPATTDPLVSLQGKIHHVDTKEVVRSGKKYHMCASIALVPINVVEVKNQNVCRLIVTNYPLATGIQLGIVKGAILRAVNVHALGQFNGSEQVFGACLRSTISLVCSSTEASSNGKGFLPWICRSQSTRTRWSGVLTCVHSRLPYVLSLLETGSILIMNRILRKILRIGFTGAFQSQTVTPPVLLPSPRLQQWLKRLKDSQPPNEPKLRQGIPTLSFLIMATRKEDLKISQERMLLGATFQGMKSHVGRPTLAWV